MKEWNTSHIKNIMTLGHNRKLKAKNINVFIEDGHPYIHWTGEFEDEKGIYEVDIPKMDINIDAIIEDRDYEFDPINGLEYPKITFARQIYATQENANFNISVVTLKLTKEQIEKKLGHKIYIQDEDDD